MIASLAGVVEFVGLDRLVVRVGGVGLLVHTTPTTAGSARTGAETTLATSLVVREDSLTLFGFATRAERDMFETVQTVSGVGPRLALAMLSVMGPEELRAALASGDARALTKIPGVGPKSADRLVLELRDKVGAAPGAGSGAAAAHAPGDWRAPVTEALVGLGWNAKQAESAVEKVAAGEGAAAGDIAAYLRLALRELRR
jgi:Holliday junction DNA helicase RuvA